MLFHNTSESKRLNAISIAAIHATILTILIGFVSAYGIFKKTRIQELENGVINKAEKINLVKFERTIYFPSNQVEDLNTIENINKYADEIRNYFGIPSPGQILKIDKSGKVFFPSKKTSLEEKAQEARKALGLMNIIFHYYPFPKSYWKLKDNRGWDVESPTKYIYFQDVEDVNKWLDDVKRVTKALHWVFSLIDFAEISPESVLALDQVEKKKKQNIGPLPIRLGEERTPFSILKSYFANYKYVRKVIEDTEYNLKRLNKLKRDFPKFTILLSISAIFLTFIFGVIFPIIMPTINKFFFVWIPIVFYFIAFGFVFFKIFKI